MPGAVAGWFALLERWGTRSFGDLAAGAIALADDGFTVSEQGATEFVGSREWYRDLAPWTAQYGEVDAGTHFRQPAIARTYRYLAEHGPDGFYRGPIAAAVADVDAGCRRRHDGRRPRRARGGVVRSAASAEYRGVTIAELPPPTQGAAVLEALRILDGIDLPADRCRA